MEKVLEQIQKNIEGEKAGPTAEPEVYTKAVIYHRELWYIGKGRQRTRVPREDRPKVLRQMKVDQVNIYSEVCTELSTDLLPNREYNIGHGDEIEIREQDLALLD